MRKESRLRQQILLGNGEASTISAWISETGLSTRFLLLITTKTAIPLTDYLIGANQ